VTFSRAGAFGISLAVILLAPIAAIAQNTNAEARAAFEHGVSALDEGRYREAVELLERSRAIRDVPVVEYNLGLAYRGIGRYRDAIASFEHFLAHPDPGSAPAEIETVRHTVAELRSALVTLDVHVTPSQAVVHVDGHPLELANGSALVDPGPHVIEVSADGFTTERRDMNLARGGHQQLELALRPSGGPAHLVVVPSVASAVTRIDGFRHPTAIVDVELPAGEHSISIRAQGYEPFERSVVMPATGLVRVEAPLARVGHTPLMLPIGIAAGGVLVVGGVILGAVLLTQPHNGLPHTTLPTIYE
jgi:hypothetical protein